MGVWLPVFAYSGFLSLPRRRGPALLDSHGGVSLESAAPDLSAAWSPWCLPSHGAFAACERSSRSPLPHIATHPILLHSHPRSACLHSHLLASFICCIATTVFADLLCCCPPAQSSSPTRFLPPSLKLHQYTTTTQHQPITGRP